MRMSCNGCRVLRKGCSEKCTIRPCLEWIKTREGQGNATEFLAKFYGRAGLMNLINAGPEHLRPAIFRSLLQEACGRIVNPISGSVGLLQSGSWDLCQAAVEAVLKGEPISPIPSDAATEGCSPPLKSYDIRHVIDSDDRKRSKNRRAKTGVAAEADKPGKDKPAGSCRRKRNLVESRTESSRHDESSLSHQSEVAVEVESTISTETVEKSPAMAPAEVVLELTLGLEPVVPMKKRRIQNFDTCNLQL